MWFDRSCPGYTASSKLAHKQNNQPRATSLLAIVVLQRNKNNLAIYIRLYFQMKPAHCLSELDSVAWMLKSNQNDYNCPWEQNCLNGYTDSPPNVFPCLATWHDEIWVSFVCDNDI